MLSLFALPASATETDSAAASIPDAARIDGLMMVWQDFNRCSAAALTIQLSHFDEFNGDYTAVIRRLNPGSEDVSVRIEEMVSVAEEYGLKGIVRRGGTVDLLKRLVAAGFPVLIENSYYEGSNGFRDWMSHNRVLIGYDEATQEFIFMDSLLGKGEDNLGIRKTYDDIDERWRAFNRDYLVIYRPDDEAALQAVMGEQWDSAYNAQWTLEQAQADLDNGLNDSFTHHNLGWAQFQLGQYEEAAASFDTAIAKGLPWRFFWYEYAALEAYLQVGRYDDVIAIVRKTVADAPGIEEMYYYIALAYEGQGNTERALANLNAALYRNRYFTEALVQLNRLNAGG